MESALKTTQQAHGSSSMIMENALIIDECFVSSDESDRRKGLSQA